MMIHTCRRAKNTLQHIRCRVPESLSLGRTYQLDYLCLHKFNIHKHMYRTHHCGVLRLKDQGQQVSLAGWVQTIRKFGSITFVDLRDRYGITQLLMGESLQGQLDQQPLGREFVLQVKGTVQERTNKNPNLPCTLPG